jgi:hypothetical protein
MVGEAAKNEVLNRLAGAQQIKRLPKHKARIKDTVIHVRFRSGPKKPTTSMWSFNINPNTLTADLELWICGSAKTYYLIPRAAVQQIYNDPAGWPDHTHGGIRVAEINSDTH